MPRAQTSITGTLNLTRPIAKSYLFGSIEFAQAVNEFEIGAMYTLGKLYSAEHNLPNDKHSLGKAQNYVNKYRGMPAGENTSEGAVRMISGLYSSSKKRSVPELWASPLLRGDSMDGSTTSILSCLLHRQWLECHRQASLLSLFTAHSLSISPKEL